MLELLTPRVNRRSARRYIELGLNDEIFERSEELISRALEGGRQQTREALYDVLARGGINPEGQRSYHILGYLAQKGVICLGAREVKQQTFVLFDEWVADSRRLERDRNTGGNCQALFHESRSGNAAGFHLVDGACGGGSEGGSGDGRPKTMQEEIEDKNYWFSSLSVPARGRRVANRLFAAQL